MRGGSRDAAGMVGGSRRFVIETNALASFPSHPHTPLKDKIFSAGHGVYLLSPVVAAGDDLWVTGLRWEVQNAPPHIVHHAVFQRIDRMDPVCPRSWEELFTGSIDTIHTSVVFPSPYGIFLPKGTPLEVNVMAHNPVSPHGPGGIYENVSVRLVMDVERATVSRRHRRLEYRRLRLDDSPCADPVTVETFVIPARSAHARFTAAQARNGPFHTAEYTFMSSGMLFGVGGHIHAWEGGESVGVFLNGDILASLVSRQTADNLWSWETPHIKLFRRVAKGDVLSIDATYSNPQAAPLVDSAMGQIGFYFAPDTK
ncbi:MAG: hypothetical protein AAB539_02725 [Patescibacteria group bacterium]